MSKKYTCDECGKKTDTVKNHHEAGGPVKKCIYCSERAADPIGVRTAELLEEILEVLELQNS